MTEIVFDLRTADGRTALQEALARLSGKTRGELLRDTVRACDRRIAEATSSMLRGYAWSGDPAYWRGVDEAAIERNRAIRAAALAELEG